jgi:hypothetical protein
VRAAKERESSCYYHADGQTLLVSHRIEKEGIVNTCDCGKRERQPMRTTEYEIRVASYTQNVEIVFALARSLS